MERTARKMQAACLQVCVYQGRQRRCITTLLLFFCLIHCLGLWL